MKNINVFKLLFVPLLVCTFMIPAHTADKQKIAQTGFQFLSVISDARAAGLGGAVNSLELGSSSLFFNPAGMARMNTLFDFTASDNRWIADIHHNTFSLAVNPKEGRWGVFGFSFQSVDYGEIIGTLYANTPERYVELQEKLKPTAYSFGFGYAKALSDKFSVGGQIHWVKQDFGDITIHKDDTTLVKKAYSLTPLAYDFGTLFKTGIKSLTFGMSVRNFSEQIKYIEDGFQLPMVFTLGISVDMFDFITVSGPKQSAILSIDARHDRSHAEQVLVGLDYKFMNILSLRTGYVSNADETGMNYGLGVSLYKIEFDYAYTPYGIFKDVQRMTVRFTL
jgi:hypothetical protein